MKKKRRSYRVRTCENDDCTPEHLEGGCVGESEGQILTERTCNRWFYYRSYGIACYLALPLYPVIRTPMVGIRYMYQVPYECRQQT
jgi:hypothetical protein